MKPSYVLLPGLVLFAAVTVAQKAKSTGHLHDKNGTFAVDGIASHLTEGTTDRTKFDFAGHPLTGYSKGQGLSFVTTRIRGLLVSKNGTSTLESAVLTGSVRVVVRADGAKGTSQDQIQSEKVDFKQAEGGPLVILPGPFSYTSTLKTPTNDQVMILSAPSGKVLLFPFEAKKEVPLRHAELSGPIKLSIKNSKPGEKGVVNQNIKATGDHLVFDQDTRTLVLSQNVTVDGDQSQDGNVFYGNLTGEKLTIKLNDKMEMVGYVFSGPGDGSVRDGGGRK